MANSNKSSDESLLDAERDVQARLGDQTIDYPSLDAISNIYRAAAAVRRRAESDVLARHSLSFGGFTILWVLWIWGDMQSARLADECGVAKGTLTGMLTTLERRGLVTRAQVASDKRRVVVSLADAGTAMITDVFPTLFNTFEGEMTTGLTVDEKRELARLLRIVITNAAPSTVE